MLQADPHLRPKPDGSDVRAVVEEDVPAVARTLGLAFRDNPGMAWTFRNDAKRQRKLARGFAQYLRAFWLTQGELFTIDGAAGAAIWMPPGRWHAPARVQLAMLPGMVRNVGTELPRFLRFYSLIERKHPSEPHWYLNVLGVHPDLHGRGFGSHLMQPVLRRCDAEGVPAYLETDTERARALYERHGFEVTERFDLPGGGPPIWLMWREPG